MESHYPFTLPPLPYAYDALEPELDGRLIHFHHDKHFAAYVDRLDRILAQAPAYQSWSLEQLCTDWPSLPCAIRQDVRNNAGGVYNHDLYFRTLHPLPVTSPGVALRAAIQRDFGGTPELKAAMRSAALAQFGSGWAWLTEDCDGRLAVCRTPNQDTPLPLQPLLGCDVWEHAYYLQYQDRRGDYFDAWWRLIDWPEISQRYEQYLSQRPHYPDP